MKTIVVDDRTHQRLKILSAKSGKSIKAIVQELLASYNVRAK